MLVDVDRMSQPIFRGGNGTVGTDAVALYPVSCPISKHVVITAGSGNSNVIRIGNSAANAANGFILSAGEKSPPIYVDDLAKVFVVGGAAGQNYSWIAT